VADTEGVVKHPSNQINVDDPWYLVLWYMLF